VLSGNTEATIFVESLQNDVDASGKITREEFEALCEPLAARIVKPMQQVRRHLGRGFVLCSPLRPLAVGYDTALLARLLGLHVKGHSSCMSFLALRLKSRSSSSAQRQCCCDVAIHQ